MMMSIANTPPDSTKLPEYRSRSALRVARRVVVKAGTSVVANDDGSPSLVRLGAIIEQIAELTLQGTEVIFVSSGAVGMGKCLLRKQARLSMSFKELQTEETSNINSMKSVRSHTSARFSKQGDRMKPSSSIGNLFKLNENLADMDLSAAKSYAAAGQFEMMNLYNSLLSPKGVAASQILLTQNDFQDEQHINSLRYAVERLLSLGIVPIINENDAVSVTQCPENGAPVFTDNDSLAALCARTFGAEVLLLLTDVEGVFNMPPSNPKAKLLPFYHENSNVAIGEKSSQGRGGMGAKIEAALSAVRLGSECAACVIAAGSDLDSIRAILSCEYKPEFGPPKGTLFTTPGSDLEMLALEELVVAIEDEESCSEVARDLTSKARKESRKLQTLPHSVRKAILHAIADTLVDREADIMQANQLDMEAVQSTKSKSLLARFRLTPEKLAETVECIRQLADMPDQLGVVKSKKELADGLELSLTTVPIGVLLVIFESRPESWAMIVSLALITGNGLLLKGGKDTSSSHALLHEFIGDAIEAGSGGEISRDIVGLVSSRRQVEELLGNMDEAIDLVIPRGGKDLNQFVKENTNIPILGQSDGVCHVYVDKTANQEDACNIVVDAKTNFVAASNSMETLLLHESTLHNGIALHVLQTLRTHHVRCYGGPKAMQAGLCDVATEKKHHEYEDLGCTVEIVDSVDEAINWINENGSGHTESIVCDERDPVADEFIKRVDAACVFMNASTRFSDGFKFGLGGEMGISTGRIHARGPLGADGLLSTKWQLKSLGGTCLAGDFSGSTPQRSFTHKDLPIN